MVTAVRLGRLGSGNGGLLVDTVAAVVVELVRQQLARAGRVAGRKRHRLSVERHALEPGGRLVFETDAVAEPR
jgi:hypothetical protein